MTTPIVDPTFQPGCYIFGYTITGMGHFGNTRWYSQTAIFGTRPFGTEIPGKNTEEDVFQFRYGSPVPRAKGPWPITPDMSLLLRGPWAKRIVHYVRLGKPQLKRYRPQDSTSKQYIEPFQLKLMESSFLWSCLTDESKARLEADAKRTGQATQGHNYFTKLYIQDNPKWLDYV